LTSENVVLSDVRKRSVVFDVK